LSRSRKILEAVTKGGAMVGPAFGEFGMLAALGLVALSAASKQKKISPEQRIIYADQRAMHYMVDAGYDPQGMIDLLYKFLNAEKQVAPYFYDYYQSRPISQPRFQALQREFSVLPLQGKTLSTNQKQYQEMTHGVRQMYEHT
jgi:predicted Zn-dependent protease